MTNTHASQYESAEYELKIVIVGTGVDVRLNDISIEFESFKGHSTTSYDVNQNIIAGINELKVITFPFFDKSPPNEQSKNYHPEAEIEASLFEYSKDTPDKKTLLSQIHIKLGGEDSEIINLSSQIKDLKMGIVNEKMQPLSYPSHTIKKQIVTIRKTLPVSKKHPRWDWQDGQIIEDTKENFDSLLLAYREIYKAHQTKDQQKLLMINNESAKEYAIAYSLAGGAIAGHDFISTGKILKNQDFELDEFFIDGTKLDIFANGKLARIIDVAQYHPITYSHKTMNLINKLKFAFYKNKNNKWILIR